jgi:hypothetical protein
MRRASAEPMIQEPARDIMGREPRDPADERVGEPGRFHQALPSPDRR